MNNDSYNNYIKCENCGMQNIKDQINCMNCGTKLSKNLYNNINVEKEKEVEKIIINPMFFKIINIIITVFTVLIFIFGIIDIYRIIDNGLNVIAKKSIYIKFLSIIELLAPIICLIGGIFNIMKIKSKEKKDRFTVMILYGVSTLFFLIPMFLVPDIFYIIIGSGFIKYLVLSSIITFYIFIIKSMFILTNLKIFNKKIFKIFLIIIVIIVFVIIFIFINNILSPSLYLLPDYS